MDSKEVLKLYMEAFSKNLKKVRSRKFSKMNDVPKNSLFDKSNYSKYELGKANPTIETILKIASILEIEPKEFFNFDFDIKKYPIDDAHRTKEEKE